MNTDIAITVICNSLFQSMTYWAIWFWSVYIAISSLSKCTHNNRSLLYNVYKYIYIFTVFFNVLVRFVLSSPLLDNMNWMKYTRNNRNEWKKQSNGTRRSAQNDGKTSANMRQSRITTEKHLLEEKKNSLNVGFSVVKSGIELLWSLTAEACATGYQNNHKSTNYLISPNNEPFFFFFATIQHISVSLFSHLWWIFVDFTTNYFSMNSHWHAWNSNF